MDLDMPEQPAFRPSKRRKVIRQRITDTESVEGQHADNAASDEVSDGTSIQANRFRATRSARKQGMTFGSSVSVPVLKHPDQVALVAASPESSSDQAGRFVKPTGPMVVTEDKHMSAFIDARLAELRSEGDRPKELQDSGMQAKNVNNAEPSEHIISDNNTSSNLSRLERTDKGITDVGRSPAKTKKHRNEPSAADVERDKLVEQILHENSSSIYDTSRQDQSTRSDGDSDVDAAAAHAFKMNFLADLKERNYARRQPAFPQNTTSGPKLGGSRADREKMKALDEAAKSKAVPSQSKAYKA